MNRRGATLLAVSLLYGLTLLAASCTGVKGLSSLVEGSPSASELPPAATASATPVASHAPSPAASGSPAPGSTGSPAPAATAAASPSAAPAGDVVPIRPTAAPGNPSPAPGGSRSPGPGSISGGIIADEEAPRPTTRPGTPATAAPTPTVATPAPAQGPFAAGVVVSPTSARIRFAPRDDTLPPIGPSSVQLDAQVTLTNGIRTSRVVWTSSATAVASVDALGLVRAGTAAGPATIRATAMQKTPEGQDAFAECTVTVSDLGDVELIVE